jgi:hypothetical protein
MVVDRGGYEAFMTKPQATMLGVPTFVIAFGLCVALFAPSTSKPSTS